jgi:hypothetical protein
MRFCSEQNFHSSVEETESKVSAIGHFLWISVQVWGSWGRKVARHPIHNENNATTTGEFILKMHKTCFREKRAWSATTGPLYSYMQIVIVIAEEQKASSERVMRWTSTVLFTSMHKIRYHASYEYSQCTINANNCTSDPCQNGSATAAIVAIRLRKWAARANARLD